MLGRPLFKSEKKFHNYNFYLNCVVITRPKILSNVFRIKSSLIWRAFFVSREKNHKKFCRLKYCAYICTIINN